MHVGDRVSDKKHYHGTVRFMGPVATSKDSSQIWVGVEWDDETRGKHDGSVTDSEGVKHTYFECSRGACASFVKEKKLKIGESFVTSLRSRYEADAKDGEIGSAQTVRGHAKPIEFVGSENIQKKQNPILIDKVSLENSWIGHAGAAGEIAEACPRISTLDLQHTLVQWNEVVDIASQLPDLTVLDLSSNRLGNPPPSTSAPQFASLRSLVLNHTKVDWCVVA